MKKFREEYGEPDVVEVRQTFPTDTLARKWEEKVLRRLKTVKDERWLNQCVSGAEWFYFKTEPASDITKQKMREYHLNRTEEHKRHLKENHKGYQNWKPEELAIRLAKRSESPTWWNEEHRNKIAELNRAKANDPEWRKKISERTLAYYDRVGRKPREEKDYPETGRRKRKTEEHRKAISEGLRGKKHPTDTCRYCGKIASKSNIARWHNENCKEK